jgi:hypothetical protein
VPAERAPATPDDVETPLVKDRRVEQQKRDMTPSEVTAAKDAYIGLARTIYVVLDE